MICKESCRFGPSLSISPAGKHPCWVDQLGNLQIANVDDTGGTWITGPLSCPDQEQAGARPSIIHEGDVVWVAWSGADRAGTLNIALSRPVEKGKPVTFQSKAVLWQYESTTGVALAYHAPSNHYYLAWADVHHRIHLAWTEVPLDASAWTSIKTDQSCLDTPALCATDDALWMAWTGFKDGPYVTLAKGFLRDSGGEYERVVFNGEQTQWPGWSKGTGFTGVATSVFAPQIYVESDGFGLTYLGIDGCMYLISSEDGMSRWRLGQSSGTAPAIAADPALAGSVLTLCWADAHSGSGGELHVETVAGIDRVAY